jgi:hypothetical protein
MPTGLRLVHTICLPEIRVKFVKLIFIVFLQNIFSQWHNSVLSLTSLDTLISLANFCNGWSVVGWVKWLLGCCVCVCVCHYCTVCKETCSIYSNLSKSSAATLRQCFVLCGYLPHCAKVLTTVCRWIIINHLEYIKIPNFGHLVYSLLKIPAFG